MTREIDPEKLKLAAEEFDRRYISDDDFLAQALKIIDTITQDNEGRKKL